MPETIDNAIGQVEIAQMDTNVARPSAMEILHSLPNGTKAKGGIPLAIVMTENGIRGVFWKGTYMNLETVGVVKVKNNGFLYKKGKYSGCRFINLDDLGELEGNS